jgi:hypothetical protein
LTIVVVVVVLILIVGSWNSVEVVDEPEELASVFLRRGICTAKVLDFHL